MLECGHPEDFLIEDGTDPPGCMWCLELQAKKGALEELSRLRKETDQLRKKPVGQEDLKEQLRTALCFLEAFVKEAPDNTPLGPKGEDSEWGCPFCQVSRHLNHLDNCLFAQADFFLSRVHRTSYDR